jgi:hypothetical protein
MRVHHLLVAVGLVFSACSCAETSAEQGTATVAGSDRLPNRTAGDWVTYADYVVVVSARSDSEADGAGDGPEDGGMVMRNVELAVDTVVWTNPRTRADAPSDFTWPAFGWLVDGDVRREVVGEDSPRVEVGHRYLMALHWEAERCSEGDPRQPARWVSLGSDSIIPFDTEVLGDGENMGREVRAARALATISPESVDYSLEDRVTGKSIDDLVSVLGAAKPVKKERFSVPAPCP